MEIIKHGKKHHTTTCPKCGCEFTFNENEKLTYSQIIEIFNFYVAYDFIKCPECGYNVVFEESDANI